MNPGAQRLAHRFMAKIGMTMPRQRAEDPLALHFGKAKWLMIYDTAGGTPQFIENTGLDGRWVAARFAKEGVTRVIAWRLGQGALVHLRAFGIKVLEGNKSTPASALAEAARLDKLPELRRAPSHPGRATCGEHSPPGQ